MSGKGTVGNDPPDVGFAGGHDQGRRSAPADAEETETSRIMIVPRPQIGQGTAQVVDLVLGRPLQRSVVGIEIAGSVIAEVEREEAEAQIAEMVEVGMEAPAIAEIFVAIDDHAGLLVASAPGDSCRARRTPSSAMNSTDSPRSIGLTLSGMKSGCALKDAGDHGRVLDGQINDGQPAPSATGTEHTTASQGYKLDRPITDALLTVSLRLIARSCESTANRAAGPRGLESAITVS